MAHFAKLGANGKVIQVLTLDNKDMLNADGVEDEAVGQQYLEQHNCLLYTSPSPRDVEESRMPSSA